MPQAESGNCTRKGSLERKELEAGRVSEGQETTEADFAILFKEIGEKEWEQSRAGAKKCTRPEKSGITKPAIRHLGPCTQLTILEPSITPTNVENGQRRETKQTKMERAMTGQNNSTADADRARSSSQDYKGNWHRIRVTGVLK
jgi:hypothetical protein